MAKAKTKPTDNTTNGAIPFSAEVGKVLQLVIHSLYTNKDIFLRELISNASDACDKLRYEALTQPELLKEDPELKIQISFDDKAKTLTIEDNGIGMSREELVNNLGTIAKSGTQGFLTQLTGDSKKDMHLIGQFGVGFYSAFMVANSVTVVSRRAGQDKAHIWTSDGEGTFTVTDLEGAAPRGTRITLSMKDDAKVYLDQHRLSHIIQTYSDHIGFPILLAGNTVNQASALWSRPKSDITKEQYQEFYRHVAHQADEPWMVLHNRNEGAVQFTNLLFIPGAKPFDLFHPDRMARVKLYVKRVYITDENIDIIPRHMRFLRGVVDSEDLPLNISRETLQHNAVIAKIRSGIVSKVLSELKKKAEKEPEDYAKFWDNFGAVLKEGLCDTSETRDKLLEVCRFHTANNGDKLTSLDEYIANMKPNQKEIYYLTGAHIETMKSSPQLEGFAARGIDVVLLADSVDDFWVNVVTEYKDKSFRSITRAGIDLSDIPVTDEAKKEEESSEAPKEDTDKIIAFFKTTLGDKVKEVRATSKLSNTPACLAAEERGMDIRFERFLVEQKQLPGRAPKILEINPQHAVVKALGKRIGDEKSADEARDLAWLVFEQAVILEGEELPDPKAFATRMNRLLKAQFQA